MTRRDLRALAAIGVCALAALAMMMWQRTRSPLGVQVASAPERHARRWDGQLTAARAVALNTAGVDALQRLPGIGPVLAERIVAFRARHGRFHDLRDLERIGGIGPKTVEAIDTYVTVR